MHKRKECIRNEEGWVEMSESNLKICVENMEEGYTEPSLNDSLHLHYYGFRSILNLQPFSNINTLFLNNNALTSTQGLPHLTQLRTLNLAHNAISILTSLNSLTLLHTLDLSHNSLSLITPPQIEGLNNLATLKLGHNRLTQPPPLGPLPALTYLDLSHNPDLPPTPEHLDYLASSKLTVLNQMGTPLPKNMPSYRKNTICSCPSLLYLDDRPVSSDERALSQAWRQGGLSLEKKVRAKIQEGKELKHKKLYEEIEGRLKQAQEKRQQAFLAMTELERAELEGLRQEGEQIPGKAILVEELERYLQLVRAGMEKVDVEEVLRGGEVVLPAMIVDRATPTTIYVYNITPEQLPLVKAKYYPEEQREIVAISISSKAAQVWGSQQREGLRQAYRQVGENPRLLTAAFNLRQYALNRQGRLPVRYEYGFLEEHVAELRRGEQGELDQLD